MSIQTKGLLKAYEDGYRVVDGEVISPYSDEPRSLRIDTRGYKSFTVKIEGRYYPVNVPVHRLLAYQKYGDALLEDGIEARHLDGDQLNNLDDNINIGTHGDNMMDKSPEQRRIDAGNHGRKHPHDEILEFYDRTGSYKETMRRFNLTSKGTLHYILKKSMARENDVIR